MRARILAILLLVSLLPLAAQTQDEWYVGKPIKDIVFEGLHNVSSLELRGVVEPYIGRLFDDALFWELQGRLYALDLFEVISPTAVPVDTAAQAIYLKFTVTEKPVIGKIIFVGNSGLRRNELLDLVTVKIGDVISDSKIRLDEQKIRESYLEKGYPNISVRYETAQAEDGTITINFIIDEGEKLALDAIRFEGNTIFSGKALLGLMTLKPKGLLNEGAFQEARLAADQEAIIKYYRDRGYVDAAIVDITRETTTNDKGERMLSLTIKIQEGKRYSLASVSFNGNKIFPTEQLQGLVTHKAGQILNYSRLVADFQRVADLYYENGYIFNTLSNVETRDEEAGTIAFTINIIERGRAHIENIIIRGNEKTRESVILREIPLESGDIFSKGKVMSALRNLYSLQYFSNVSIETPQGSADSLMDLVFNVEEQSTSDIQFGLTFSGISSADDLPISGMVKWNDRNFLGTGNIFSIEANVSKNEQKLVFGYTQRWLFGLPLSGGFDFTISHALNSATQDSLYPIFNGDEEEAYPDGYDNYEDYESGSIDSEYLMNYDDFDVSVGFSTGYRWTLGIGNLSLGGGLRSGAEFNSYNAMLYRPFDPELREGNNSLQWGTTLWASVALDARDVYYDPTNGYYLIQRINNVGVFPFDNEHFIRTDTDAEAFFTLLSIPMSETFTFKAIFGIHSGLSLIWPSLGGAAIVENAKKLYIDGMFSARGWTDQRNRKGKALWENWAELRFPIAQNMLAFDLFFDAAAIKADPEALFTDFSMDDFLFSFGGGLRFSIPQFPFRFSLAKRFRIQNGQVAWEEGDIWSDGSPLSGLDFVLSFALSTY